jgi:hypothetical protein
MLKTLKSVVLATVLAAATALPVQAQTMQQNNEAMFKEMQAARGLSNAEMNKIKALFARAPWMGQGNPAVTRHPMTPQATGREAWSGPQKLLPQCPVRADLWREIHGAAV